MVCIGIIGAMEDEVSALIKQMEDTVNDGLNLEGMINEELNYYRVAKKLYEKAKEDKDYIVAYSYAACEENAAGHKMCTSPTLGACGILNSLIYYLKHNKHESDETLCNV